MWIKKNEVLQTLVTNSQLARKKQVLGNWLTVIGSNTDLNTDYYLLAAFFKNLKDFMVVIVPVFTSSHSEQSS